MNFLTGDQALQELMNGNKRYVAAELAHPNQTAARRAEVAKGQDPFAIIVGCSDSRVPPEIIFDQGLGDLFVTRVAGNIVDDVVLGSIEYAAEHLGVPLIVVLGHKRCGAVEAAAKGGDAPVHIRSLVEAIKPAIKKAKG
jgi:carbonic anhydrase